MTLDERDKIDVARTRITFYITNNKLKALKYLSIEKDQAVSSLITAAITNYIIANEKDLPNNFSPFKVERRLQKGGDYVKHS